MTYFDKRLGPQSPFFVERLKATFEDMKKILRGRQVEIGTAAPGSTFVLGDTPALTVDSGRKLVGFLAGVSMNGADLLVMPFSPEFTISFVTNRTGEPYIEVPAPIVQTMNDWQTVGARQHVIAKPGSEHRELTGHYVEVWNHRGPAYGE